MNLGKGEVGVINLVCTVLETCHGYLDSKKISTRNQRFLLLVEFKVHTSLVRNISIAVPMCPCSRSSRSWMSWMIWSPT